MADYINSNILCQAYVHIEPVDLSSADIDRIKQVLNEFVTARGQFFLYPEVDVDVTFKEGSLKKYLTIFGSLYIFLHQYPDFREGVILFSNDVKRLGESIVSESLFLARARHQNTLRTEARTGVVGSLRELVDDITYVEEHIGATTAEHLHRRLRLARIRAQNLMEVLADDKDRTLVSEKLSEIVIALPEAPPPPPKKRHPLGALAVFKKERESLLEALKPRKKIS